MTITVSWWMLPVAISCAGAIICLVMNLIDKGGSMFGMGDGRGCLGILIFLACLVVSVGIAIGGLLS